MKVPAWQLGSWRNLRGAWSRAALGHALLFTGPQHIGKRALAEALTARLLCEAAESEEMACGRCRACALLAAGNHPDRREVGLLEREDGRLKTEIGVEQVRALSAWFALTPQLGRAQVAIIDPADHLHASAANALLKTLEEPLPERFLLLLATQPQRLPATIRSRCQRLQLPLPAPAQARDAVLASGADAEAAEAALAAADGNPGLALDYLAGDVMALRRAVHEDLAALANGRLHAAPLAAAWVQDRPDLRLRFAAESVRDFGRRRAVAPAGLTALGDFPKLAAWFDHANRVRLQLDAPLRHELLLTGLLSEWSAAFERPAR